MATLPALVSALTWESLVAPTGDLTGDHFPGEMPAGVASERLQGRLDGYLADAGERLQPAIDAAAVAAPVVPIVATAARDAALAWAYHRAYRAIASRMAAAPSTESLEREGSHGWTVSQLDDVQRRADEARAAFEGYVAGVLSAASAPSTPRSAPPRASSSTPVTFAW